MPLSPAPGGRGVARPSLAVTRLEDRLTPALTFQFDYRYDTTGFFADPAHKAALERAGAGLLSRVDSSLGAVAPAGGNTWSEVFVNPATGQPVKVANPTVPADTIVVYVAGAAGLGGSEAGEGGPGGYDVTGSRAWQAAVADRGVGSAGTWGGDIAFSTSTDWYFGADIAGRVGNQVDFQTVAAHELGHVLGIGTSPAWTTLVSGGVFTGPAATAANNGKPVKVSPDGAHLAQGTVSDGGPVALQPVLAFGKRVGLTTLDYAVLSDLGWRVTGFGSAAAVPPVVAAVPPTFPTAPNPVTVPPAVPAGPPAAAPAAPAGLATVTQQSATGAQVAGVAADKLVIASGPDDGTVQAYSTATGSLVPAGSRFAPFPGFAGAVRAVAADVNGDGVADYVLATGPGGGSRVRVIDGRTFTDLVTEYWAFEPAFNGGVFVAAADFDADGRAEVVITPDQGGGPRVKVIDVAAGRVTTRADFFGLNDPAFRGGARVAAGDLNRDGVPDLVVAAGYGGGPRVSLIDGTSVLGGVPRTLTADFFAFDPGLRNGVYVAVGDTDGDGYADLVVGAGPGGGPRVLTLSGRTLVAAGGTAAVANPLGNTFAGDPARRGGARVAAKDVTGDGLADVVAGAGTGGTLTVLLPRAGYAAGASLDPFAGAPGDGIYVG